MVVVLVVDVFSSLSFSSKVAVVVVFHSLLNIAEAAAEGEVGVLKSANIT